MAIIKVVKKSGKNSKAVKSVVGYVGKKAFETYGINCNSDYTKVANEFFETKKYFNKTNGRQYRHYIQSFSLEEVSKENILEIGIKWAEKAFPNHEVFIAAHDDREHLHNHFIVNTVNFETGEKLHESACNLAFKKELNDEICLNYGIKNNKITRKRGDIIAYDKNKYQIIKKAADITRLAENILEHSRTSQSKDEFIKKMSKAGYETEWNDNKKNVVFTVSLAILKGKKKKFRLSNLQQTFNIPEFEKEKLLEIFSLNTEREKNTNLKDIINQMEIRNIEIEKETEKISKFEWQEQNKNCEIEL